MNEARPWLFKKGWLGPGPLRLGVGNKTHNATVSFFFLLACQRRN
jgi:hypothetical protein